MYVLTIHVFSDRVSSLLPKAKLIAILHDPVKRAYSWYQHMRAHNDPTALNYNFSQVIQATPQSLDKKLLSLRDHCLSPGRYHIHLSRWLKYYSYKQIFLVDGDELTSNPAVVMDRVQTFIQIERVMNYSKILRLVLWTFEIHINNYNPLCMHSGVTISVCVCVCRSVTTLTA